MVNVHRNDLEPLLDRYRGATQKPDWLRNPSTELQFVAALLLEVPSTKPVFDSDGYVVAVQGIKLKGH